jgi:hypothetical protein
MKKQITALVSLGVFCLGVTPAVMAEDVVISDNGAKSESTVVMETADMTLVGQSNITTVETQVTSKADTGDNKVTGNTGSDSTLITGGATSSVDVLVTGSVNMATMDGSECGCVELPTVKLTDNGYKSEQKVTFRAKTLSQAHQLNLTTVLTGVKSTAKTGKSVIKWNTGGTSGLATGEGLSLVSVSVEAPTNTLE